MPRHSPPTAHVLVGILGWVVTSGCGTPPAGEPSTEGDRAVDDAVVVDAAGIEHRFEQPALRIVSLVPSATTTLRAIGAEAALVGRTDFDRKPWVVSLPSVGGGLDPSLEAIVALRPDLVIRFAGEQDPRTPDRLDALGIRHVAVRPDHVDDIYRITSILGQATGHTEAADSLTEWIQHELIAISREAAKWPTVRVAYVLGGAPPWVAGPNTYIGEVLSIIGGDNVFADLEGLYSSVSPEEFRTRDIDVILTSAGSDLDPSLAPYSRIEVVGAGLEIPGPGIVEAARQMALILHGRNAP
jgi:iron complex transport system substrate-binding protein